MFADEEYAEWLNEQDIEEGESEPPLVGYSLLVGKMDDLRDEIRMLRVDQANLAGARGKFRAVQRPRTALEKLKQSIREMNLDNLAARLMGR